MPVLPRILARLCAALILGLCGLVTAPCAEEPPAPQQTPQDGLPADAELITDPAELSALLVDRTVHAAYWPENEPWREFSAADGRTILDAQGCLRPGTWRISGSVVCYTYPSWDDGRPQCFLVYRSPAVTHFVFLDRLFGGRHLSSNAHAILEGNPEGLPIDLKTETCRDLNV